jgi:6-phosphogluconolactonase (cycloisomerase 2 family)
MRKNPIAKVILAAALAASAALMFGQEAPVAEWAVRFASPGAGFDRANALAVNPENGRVYVTGRGGNDCATLAYDPSGTVVWTQLYNGPGDGYEEGLAVAVDSGRGRIYVAGYSDGDFLTLAYDTDGLQLWAVTYNGPGNRTDRAVALAVNPDTGDVYVTGCSQGSQYDFATVAYDASGAELWTARYNGPGNWNDEPSSLALDQASGRLYVSGSSYGDSCDFATIAYSLDGQELWVARYDHAAGDFDMAYDSALDPASGNLYVAGYSYGVGCDFITVAYDGTGQHLWAAAYDGPGGNVDVASAVGVDPTTGAVYVTGYSQDASSDYATVAYDAAGQQLWAVLYDGPAGGHDVPSSLAVDPVAGRVYVTGFSMNQSVDYATVAYSSSGNELWAARYDGPDSGYDAAAAVALDPGSGSLYVTGQSGSALTGADYATVKYGGSHEPADLLAALISGVESLNHTGQLDPNKAAPLLTKLKRTQKKLEKDKLNPACNQLEAFINQVEAYIRAGILPEETGETLIGTALALIAQLSEQP